MSPPLNPDKALIFRIVHVDNLPWLFHNGLPCRNARLQHPNYRPIGNPELIARRQHRVIPVAPGGTLADYVPFYFTPASPMLLNIKTGYGGIQRHANHDIAILVSSLPHLEKLGIAYVVSDRHAYLNVASFSNDRSHLGDLPWNDWQQRDFTRRADDPDRFERYQAEALAHQMLPIQALLGVVVYTESVKSQVTAWAVDAALDIDVHALPKWYFR